MFDLQQLALAFKIAAQYQARRQPDQLNFVIHNGNRYSVAVKENALHLITDYQYSSEGPTVVTIFDLDRLANEGIAYILELERDSTEPVSPAGSGAQAK